MQKILFFILFIASSKMIICSELSNVAKLVNTIESSCILGDRPAVVQAAVDQAFEKLREKNKWLCNGSYRYDRLGLDDDKLIKQLVNVAKNQSEKDVYIIDVGCANGNWGQQVFSKTLQDDACKKSGKQFHIFSVTGGQECDELVQKKGNVTLYQMNRFKIENIDEEFLKRGFDLKEKVALIVSSWTLRHLVDPFGTLKRLYSLLTPAQGALMSNGFFCKLDDIPSILRCPIGWWHGHLLAHANGPTLFRSCENRMDIDHFLLVRNNHSGLDLPIEYANEVHETNDDQIASKTIAVYKDKSERPLFEPKMIFKKGDLYPIYYNEHDNSAKELYNALAFQKLFCFAPGNGESDWPEVE